MKNTKKQLFTAVAMLLVATVALGTATYAWFVNNATVAVDQMNFQASTASSMEIAVADPTNVASPGAFKGTVFTADLNTYFKDVPSGDFGAAYMSNVLLKPASATKAGNFAFFREDAAGWNNGTQTVTTFGAINNIETTSGAGVFKIPMYLRASEKMEVYLTTATSITIKDPTATTNQAIYAMRMAIVPTGQTGNQYIFQAKATDDHIAGNLAKNTTTLLTGDASDQNKGITSVSNGVPTIEAQGAKLLEDKILYAPANATETVIPAGTPMTDKVKVMDLEANAPQKFDVYVWMEGCDWDCVTAISRGDFDINLQFIGKQLTN